MSDLSVDQFATVICNPSLPDAERRRALDALRQLDPEAPARLLSAGRIPPVSWPSVEAGPTLEGDSLVLAAIAIPRDELRSALARAPEEDPARLVLAARMAAVLGQIDSTAARDLEAAVRPLLIDRRRAFPHLPQDDTRIGQYAQQIHLQLARGAYAGDPEGLRSVLGSAIRSTLARAGQIVSLYNPFLAWLESGGETAELVRVLAEVLADPDAEWETRLAAREAIDLLRGVVASHPQLGEAAPAAVAEGIELANRELVEILRSDGAPKPLKEAVAARLHRWAPLAIGELQRERLLPAKPVPSRRVHRDWTPGAVELLSTQVDFDEVVDLLREAPEPELDRVISALRLAPVLAGWRPGAAARLDPPLRALIASELEVPMKTRPVPLGQMALDALPGLFPHAEAQEDWMKESLKDGIRRALASGRSLLKLAEWLPNLMSPASRKVVGGWMLEAAKDPARPLAQRQELAEALDTAGLKTLATQARNGLKSPVGE